MLPDIFNKDALVKIYRSLNTYFQELTTFNGCFKVNLHVYIYSVVFYV
mgnify:FL=1